MTRGFPKKCVHSVGAARQYCGQVGKQDNCCVAVGVSLATEQASLPARYQMDLPEIWASDRELRKKPSVPEEIRFQTRQEMALDQIRSLCEEGVERGVVLAAAAHGNDHGFREELEKLGSGARHSYPVVHHGMASRYASASAPKPRRPSAARCIYRAATRIINPRR